MTFRRRSANGSLRHCRRSDGPLKVTAYSFHEGLDICSEVDENRQRPVLARSISSGPRLPLSLPARSTSPLATSRGIRTAVCTCVSATTKELEKYPNAELVDVTDNTDHVCAAIVNGKLRIDAPKIRKPWSPSPFPSKPSATVSIACKKSALEFDSARLRARNFRISWLSLPASKVITDQAVPYARNDFALPPTQLLSVLLSQPLPPD